jgi:hypothetical protein
LLSWNIQIDFFPWQSIEKKRASVNIINTHRFLIPTELIK